MLKNILYIFIFLGGLFASIGSSYAQIRPMDLDSLWGIVQSKTSNDTQKVDALSKIAGQHFNTNPDSTIYFLNQSIDLAKSIGYSLGITKGYLNLGAVENFKGDLNKSFEYTLLALENVDNTKDTIFKIIILGNLAALKQEMGDVQSGQNYAQQAYDLSLKTNDISSILSSLTTLASFKASNDNCKDAIKDYKKALKTYQKYHLRNQGLFYTLSGLAECYDDLYNNNDSTLQWYQKMDTLRYEMNSLNMDIDYFKGATKNAIKYNNIEQANTYADSLLVYARKIGGYGPLQQYFLLKSEIDEAGGLYKLAYEDYKTAQAYKDSINDEKKQQQILELEMKYNSEKKSKELLLRQAELDNQKSQKMIMLIIFILGTIFTWTVIYFYFKNRKKNKLLKSQNEELEKLSIVAKEIDSTVVITDKNGRIEWINEGACDMYELTPKEVQDRIGKDIRDFSNYQGINTVIDECIKTKKSDFYTSKHFKKSGSVLWVQTTLTPILDQKGEVNRIVFIDTNVSTVKRSEVILLKQKDLLETKNNQITDSFNYAKRIQQAVLPSHQTMKEVWNEHFALLNPKDIVSGDFYWFYEKQDRKYLAVVDCTGHGVPGAFMTIIGNNLLNEILQDDFYTPAEILQELHLRIKIRLGGSVNAKVMDSMDLGLVCYNTKKQEVLFAGTHSSLYIVRGSALIEYKGSKESIGFKDQIHIKQHTIEVKAGDILYMHTDGLPDQKGGKRNKKFYYQPIRNLFLKISSKPMAEQKEIINQTFMDWKKDTEQTDDVCVVGVRIS